MTTKNIVIIKNHLAQHHLTILRNRKSDSMIFNYSLNILADIISIEALENLPLMDIEIETPITKTKTKIIDTNYSLFIVPILRAGLGIANNLLHFIPTATVQHLGMYRDEKTLQPQWYYNKLPAKFKNPNKTMVYICDPMLATGSSIIEAIKVYKDKGIEEQNITLLTIICSPEGIDRVISLYPKIRIITCSIDKKLNEKGYIVPGLGDAGDRIFNTLYY